MNRLSKADIKHLKMVASQLPPKFENSANPEKGENKTSVTVSGQKLIDQGHTKVEGEKIIPEKIYVQTHTGIKVNHFRRLKHFCERGEYAQAQDYINQMAGEETKLKALVN